MSHSRHIKRTARRRRALVPSGTKKALPQVYLRGGNKILPEIYMTDHGTHKGSMIKWMLSTIFASIFGIGAIGTVIYASMNSDKKLRSGDFATQLRDIGAKAMTPFKPLLVHRQTGPRFIGNKSDRLIVTSKGLSARHIIHDTYSKKRNNKAYLIIKPYALMATSFATASPHDQPDIPVFNPYKLYTNTAPARLSKKGGKTTPVANALTKTFVLALTISANDDHFKLTDDMAQKLVAIAASDYFTARDETEAQNRRSRQNEESGGLEAVYKNTTIIAKQAGAPVVVHDNTQQHEKTVRSGDSINTMLRAAGAEYWQSAQIIKAMNKVYAAHSLKVGHKLRYVTAPRANNAGKSEPVEIALYNGKNHLVTVARNEAGEYAASAKPGTTKFFGRSNSYPRRASLYQSFYHSGLAQKLPPETIMKLLRIHAFDTDYKRTTQPGDNFEAFFDMHEGKEQFENVPNELLFTSITINGSKRAFYRFRTPDGRIDYYDRNGKNAKKFLMRKPVRGSRVRLSSGYGSRMHPILKRRKMHNGTDWAASRGTPILAAGNGTIVKAGMTQFSGNYVKIRHANGYKTSYSHMHKISKGVIKGVRVRQGQIIGLVGNTGRSTAPHLHYEVLINNRAVNAMTIPVPRGRVLDGYLLTKFKKERDRIDELMGRDPVTTKVASAN
ncbi:MAG: M23 family metallopeptidase [bacterium]|nr:M23 family metallopeptidase [bacterium]